MKLQEWPRGFSASAQSTAPARGFFGPKGGAEAGCWHRFGTSLRSDGDESARDETDGPNSKGEKEKVRR